MAGVCALASTGLEPRTVGPAQSPGLLPVNCSTSDDYTSDLNVKGNVNSICVGYGPFVVAAHTISIQNINIVHGIIQYKIDNACDHDIQIDPDACKLEFNSIAYGCADDGRFYNGSAAYGWSVSFQGTVCTDINSRVVSCTPSRSLMTQSSSHALSNHACSVSSPSQVILQSSQPISSLTLSLAVPISTELLFQQARLTNGGRPKQMAPSSSSSSRTLVRRTLRAIS